MAVFLGAPTDRLGANFGKHRGSLRVGLRCLTDSPPRVSATMWESG